MPRNGTDAKERRAYFRLEKALKVHLRLVGNNPDRTYRATTKNISQGGLCVEIPNHQKELIEKLSAANNASELMLEALIDSNITENFAKPAWIKCNLDWANQSATKDPALTMGLSFQNLAEKTRKQIRNYIVGEFVKSYGKNDRRKASAG